MIDLTTYFLFIAASAALVIVPGPTVTVIIANSLSAGSRAGLLNVAGTQLGLGLMVLVLAFGFASIVAKMSIVFELVRVIGAIYLIWLGIKLWRSNGSSIASSRRVTTGNSSNVSKTSYLLQGFWVIWSNPKALFFFGAFIPQFVDPSRSTVFQVILLGATFMVVATILDGAYAIAAGQMRRFLTNSKIAVLEKVSGCFLIGGGIWLALGRR